MASNAAVTNSDATKNVYKCVVIRAKRYRTAFYSHTASLAQREARWHVSANGLTPGTYEITEPVQVFTDPGYI